jgi:nucleoside-diphosphate-sugar epimerase
VEANMLALKKKSLCGVFNVACGKNYTVLELARILNRVLGKNIPPVFMPERPGDVYKTLADLTSARKFLGYAPKINFLEGLRLTVEYFQKYG